MTFRSKALPCLTLALAAMLPVAARSQDVSSDVRERMSAALAEMQKGNARGYLQRMEAIVADRPDFPRAHVNLAAAYAANGLLAEATAALGQLADLGLYSAVDRSSDFAELRERDDFKAVVARLNANMNPIGNGLIEYTLPSQNGIIEGIAWRESTGVAFFGDVRNRTVWVRGQDGRISRFAEESPDLLGVFGLAIDEVSGTLWAATTGRPEMIGYEPSHANVAGVADINLTTGRVRRIFTVPVGREDHVVGDLAVGTDGFIYATDSAAPVIWRFSSRSGAVERFIESPEFASLQGIVVLPGGRSLIVSDYVNGLIAVDIPSRRFSVMPPPPETTLVGIDGLVLAPDGSIIAIQNGTRPPRILRVELDGSTGTVARVTVLESAHLTMADPGLGTIMGDSLLFVGNTGWSRFEPPATLADRPRPVPIFRTELGGDAPSTR